MRATSQRSVHLALPLLAAWLFIFPTRAAAQEGRVVDRIVAVVEGDVITLSQLELEARLLLVQLGGLEASTRPLDEAALGRALEVAIMQRLQVLEAERLNTFELDPVELETAMSRLEERFGSPEAFREFLARQDADRSRVMAVVARGLRSEKVLDSKVRLRAQVSEAEVRREYEDRRKSGELVASYEDARASLREHLYRRNYQRLARQELEGLLRNGDVRRIAPFARAQADAKRGPP